MPLPIDTLDEHVDISRLIDDLGTTMPLYRAAAEAAQPLHPTTALLRRLGEAWLDEAAQNLAGTVGRAPGFPAVVDSFIVPVLGGSVRLSYFLMSLILGRPGLRAHFLRHGAFDWSGCLRWLVLHGVREMHLWPYLSDSFVRELRAPTLLVEGKRLSPLQAIVMAERPDVLAAFRNQASPAQFARFFTAWFLDHGAAEYGHSWLMSTDEVGVEMRQNPGGAWTGEAAAAEDEARQQLDRAVYPDAASEPAGPARPAGRNGYRLHGLHYPCTFLDMSAPDAALGAIAGGEARPGLRGGLDLLSPFVDIRLPAGRDTTALIKLDLAVPEPLRRDLSVRLRVRDGFGTVRVERRATASLFGAGPMVIPARLRDLSPRLEIAFALGGRPPATGGSDAATTFAVLRSLQIWQVIAETDGTTALQAGAA